MNYTFFSVVCRQRRAACSLYVHDLFSSGPYMSCTHGSMGINSVSGTGADVKSVSETRSKTTSGSLVSKLEVVSKV